MARTRSGRTTGFSPTTATSSASSSSSSSSAAAARHRKPDPRAPEDAASAGSKRKARRGPACSSARSGEDRSGAKDADTDMSWAARNQWVVLAIASGACAAFNGVFAKLTTNDLTTHISQGISRFFGFSNFEKVLEVAVRCIFFGLNLVFNGVMWTLFTKALARGSSTTQVSIMNTSTNFVVTALLGLAVFAESLPPLWWAGAAMLVAGNVVIGRKDHNDDDDDDTAVEADHDATADSNDDLEGGRVSEEEEERREAGGGRPGYGTVAGGQRAGGGLLVPVEKDDDDDDEDEDVPLLGGLERAGTR